MSEKVELARRIVRLNGQFDILRSIYTGTKPATGSVELTELARLLDQEEDEELRERIEELCSLMREAQRGIYGRQEIDLFAMMIQKRLFSVQSVLTRRLRQWGRTR